MDQTLRDALDRWHRQITELSRVEAECLTLEANEKPLWSQLFMQAQAKTVAEREAVAYAHEDWKILQTALVFAKTKYNAAKRELELAQAAFQAEYLSAKSESEAIKKYPRGM